MKTSSTFLLSIIAASSLITTAHAQRESFETSVVRKAEVLIIEMQQPAATPGKPSTVQRSGLTHDGKPSTIAASRKAVSFDNIFFKLDSTELRDDASRLQVEEIATTLKSPKLAGTRFLIEGHTCDLGEDAHNLKLSAKRAEAIRKLLIKRGVAKDRLASLGFGEAEIVDPVKVGDTLAKAETKRMKSRRVVMRQLSPEKK
jgi:outer membrane protein OmpA-like peptidoglycan-associated protein